MLNEDHADVFLDSSAGHTRVMVERIEMEGRQERIARNEAAFREVNEQIASLNELGARQTSFAIVCECGSDTCVEAIDVDGNLYETVRASPHHFLVKKGHEALDAEWVIEDHREVFVVAKKPGPAKRIVERKARDGDNGETISLRIAENEARFRDANEHIEEAVIRLESNAPSLPFVCECGRPDCLKTMRLTIAEYEQARTHPRYFVCIPGHEILGENLGRLVRTTDKFVIVEKIGSAGKVAEERDPRSDH